MISEALEAAADELREAERSRRLAWATACAYVSVRAEEGDAVAREVAALVADADRRANIAGLNAKYLLPSMNEETT